MGATRAGEDYLKAVYGLLSCGERATTGALARRLGVSSPSASAMIKRLESQRLVERPAGGGLRLTPEGERAALRVVRRHRLLETFLARTLGMTWDEVHAEAELLEHAVSDRLEERIDQAMGRPTRDPHGDPIPPRSGQHREDWGDRLDSARRGDRFRVVRVSDRDSESLRYLGTLGLVPGAVIQIGEKAPFGGPLWISVAGQQRALGAPLTRLVHGRIEP
ncbi:metal-dependent transcriptional regulator [Blastococcus jejuensis]|uniref:Manganese transport regulator n=1 Tax=Blastococcus jejuensis TaxID=351224 RepID=A0ABP6NSY4_9ACTN